MSKTCPLILGFLIFVSVNSVTHGRRDNVWSIWHKSPNRIDHYAAPPPPKLPPPPPAAPTTEAPQPPRNGRWVIRGGRFIWMPRSRLLNPLPRPQRTTFRMPPKLRWVRRNTQRTKPKTSWYVYKVERLSELQSLVSKVKAGLKHPISAIGKNKPIWLPLSPRKSKLQASSKKAKSEKRNEVVIKEKSHVQKEKRRRQPPRPSQESNRSKPPKPSEFSRRMPPKLSRSSKPSEYSQREPPIPSEISRSAPPKPARPEDQPAIHADFSRNRDYDSVSMDDDD